MRALLQLPKTIGPLEMIDMGSKQVEGSTDRVDDEYCGSVLMSLIKKIVKDKMQLQKPTIT